MSSKPQQRSFWKRYFRRLALRITVLLVLYVLSIGPMFKTWEEARMTGDNDAVITFYLPLMVACEESETIRSAVNSYIDLWTFS